MQITTTSRHCELDSGVRQFAQQRLEKFEKFARDIHEAHLVVTAEKFRHIAEIQLRLNHHELVSRGESPEVRVAIDHAADAIEEQLRRFKEKRVDRVRHPQAAPRDASPPADEDATDEG